MWSPSQPSPLHGSGGLHARPDCLSGTLRAGKDSKWKEGKGFSGAISLGAGVCTDVPMENAFSRTATMSTSNWADDVEEEEAEMQRGAQGFQRSGRACDAV